MKKSEREQGKNLVYEYVTQQKLNASTGNLVGRSSAPYVKMAANKFMNQTMVGGFG